MSSSKKNGGSGEVTLKIILEPSEETPVTYVNYAEVGHSQYEFSLTFARVPTKLSRHTLSEVQKSGELSLEPVFSLVLPAKVIPGLINALKVQMASYEQKFGSIAGPTREEKSNE